MYPFGQEFLNWYQCYKVHGNFHGPFRYRIFELVSMVPATRTTWKFPCTLLDKSFWINLIVTGNMEISVELFGIECLNLSQCYKLHGNFHVLFWTRIFELVSILQGTWKFPWTLSV